MIDQTIMFEPEELPQTDEPKKKPKKNVLQDMLIELMDERGLRDADVVKATGIPFPTFHDWITGNVACPLTDENLLKVGRFFNVDLYYLLYGIGSDEPHFKDGEEEVNGSGKIYE
jgi:transcriptional regulator with XRE-family HTH domain